MIPTMFQAFAYDQSKNPVTKGKHKRCSYCFSKSSLEVQSIGVLVCHRCKSVIDHPKDTDENIQRELYRTVKRDLPLFQIRAFAEFLRYLVFEPTTNKLVEPIRKELQTRGSIDTYFLDYLRSRVEKLVEIKRGVLNNSIHPELLFKFFKVTPYSLFYVLGHLLNLHYFKKETKEVVMSLFSSFGISNPRGLRQAILNIAKITEEI